MKVQKIVACLMVFVILLLSMSGCTKDQETITEKLLKQSKSVNYDNDLDFIADKDRTSVAYQVIREMDVREKIGQLLIVEPDVLLSSAENNTYSVTQYMRNQYEKYPIGGFILMSDNIKDPSQLNYLTRDLVSIGKIKSFVGVEEEGGGYLRIAGARAFNLEKTPAMKEFGEGKTDKGIETAADDMAKYLSKYSVNLNLAPDADVLTAKSGSIIGDRSFGSDPNKVAKFVKSAIEGFHKHDIMTAVKYFPGHGSVSGDSHIRFIDIDKTWEEMLKCEIIPFKAAIEAQTDMIIVSHLTVQKVSGDDLPSSLSYEIMTRKLRQELGFEGIIMTDSFSAEVIVKKFSSGTAALNSLKAGADLIALPEDYKEAFNTILKALNDGSLSMKRVNESVWRILQLKEKYGMLQ